MVGGVDARRSVLTRRDSGHESGDDLCDHGDGAYDVSENCRTKGERRSSGGVGVEEDVRMRVGKR